MILAVDTRGTKTVVALVNERSEVVRKERFLTPTDQNAYVTVLRDVIATQFNDGRIKSACVALPGIVRDGIAIWCGTLGWRDFNAQKALKGIVDGPVFIENNANLAGLAEAHALSPVPRSLLYVAIGTGIDTGIITDGSIDPGLRYSEGGQALVEFDGTVREWESFASGKAIHEAYGHFAADITSKRTWYQIAVRISRGFLATIPILQPEAIVIGGSIGTYFGRFAPELEALLIEKLPAHIPCPKILKATHPEEAVIYGCYHYAKQHTT